MKKFTTIFVLVFLAILGLKASVMAQDEIQAHITMYHYVSSVDESYAVKFEISGNQVKDVRKILVETPDRERLSFHNRLEFDQFLFSRDGMSFAEFKKRFPEGVYEINLTPRRYGRFKINIVYNFPDPVITSPADEATNVPLDPPVQWGPLSNISRLSLTARSANHMFSTDLPIDATSFTAGYDYLMPNTRYDLSLEATSTDFEGNALVSTQTISFTTVAE